MKKILLPFFVFACSLNVFAQDTMKTAAPAAPVFENKLGGHFGVVQLLFKSSSGTNEVVGEDFYAIGFPTGITVKKEDMAFDVEIVPFIDRKSNVNLLFHPGILFPLGNNFTFGTRAAFEIGQGQYGFTPLINKSFTCKNGQVTFAEIVFPVRFSANGPMTNIVGLHLGVGF
jgi:hypothetical protein